MEFGSRDKTSGKSKLYGGSMSQMLHLEILDEERTSFLPQLASFKDDFYLAGGTGLALQLGHRDSVDFDFFQKISYQPSELLEKVIQLFVGAEVTAVQEETNTLTVLINRSVKLSFFTYPYPLLKPLLSTEYFQIASLEDIGCMKLSAISSRSLLKDYVDLYFITQTIPLNVLLELAATKFPNLDSNLLLKSLVYFDDIIDEPIIFKEEHKVSQDEIQHYFVQEVQKIQF